MTQHTKTRHSQVSKEDKEYTRFKYTETMADVQKRNFRDITKDIDSNQKEYYQLQKEISMSNVGDDRDTLFEHLEEVKSKKFPDELDQKNQQEISNKEAVHSSSEKDESLHKKNENLKQKKTSKPSKYLRQLKDGLTKSVTDFSENFKKRVSARTPEEGRNASFENKSNAILPDQKESENKSGQSNVSEDVLKPDKDSQVIFEKKGRLSILDGKSIVNDSIQIEETLKKNADSKELPKEDKFNQSQKNLFTSAGPSDVLNKSSERNLSELTVESERNLSTSRGLTAADAKDLQNAEKGGRGMPCFMAGMMAVSIATRVASMRTMNMSREGALGNILKLLGPGRKTNNPPSLGEGGHPSGGGSNPPGEGSNPPGEGSNPSGGESNPPGGESNPPGEGSNPPFFKGNTPLLTVINNFNDMSVRRLDADAEEMPSEADLIPRLSPVARAFMKSNGGLEEVLQMLPASPHQLAEKLMKDGPKEYLTFLDPGMNDPVFEQLLSKVETLDKSASVGTLLSSRQSVSVESTPVELSIEPLSIASGWDSAAYLRRDVKNRDDIWHKNTEDNLFQIVSKRLRTVLK